MIRVDIHYRARGFINPSVLKPRFDRRGFFEEFVDASGTRHEQADLRAQIDEEGVMHVTFDDLAFEGYSPEQVEQEVLIHARGLVAGTLRGDENASLRVGVIEASLADESHAGSYARGALRVLDAVDVRVVVPDDETRPES